MNRLAMRSLLLMMMILVAAASATAGMDDDRPLFSLTPYGGLTAWSDDIGLEDEPIFGGRAAVHLLRWLSVEGTMGWTGTSLSSDGTDVDVRHNGVDLVLDLMPRATLNPYVLGGWTRIDGESDAFERDKRLNGWEAAAGLKIRLGGENVNRRDLRLEVRDAMSDLAHDFPNDGDMTHNLIYTAGLQFHFGRGSSDSDGDGVRDRDDACADTPLGAVVDLNGCPSDSDGDGVFDGIDQCESTPTGAVVDAHGCPVDSDGDGVFDGLDTCADTPAGASVDANGCPSDSDGDGVFDGVDQCADTPAGAVVDARGCPVDSDGDGVFDGLDECPDTEPNLIVDGKGCPVVITETETQLLDTGMIRTSEIRFQTGSSDLDTFDTAKLDEIGETLSHWPELKVEIGGHTDATGSAEGNQALSERRAQAVLDYLLANFPAIHGEQYTVKGYGEVSPIADNDTAEGRAANRRVEFKVLNADEIKRVIENRKLLER